MGGNPGTQAGRQYETALICQVGSHTSPPYKVVVVEKLGPLTYLVEAQGGFKWKRRNGSGVLLIILD